MSTVLLDVADHVATITLNAPEARNAFVDTLREDMIRVCGEVNADPRVRVAIVTGAGSATATFCSWARSMTSKAAFSAPSALMRRPIALG